MKTRKELIIKTEGLFESCHASNVELLNDNKLMVVWFAGSKEGADDIKIWYSEKTNKSWSIPKIISNEKDIPHWNPVLLHKTDDETLLFYKKGRDISRWQTVIKITKDNGKTWSEEKELVPGDYGGRGPVRNKVIKLKSGRWLAPASLENEEWRSFVDYSDDEGMSWNKSNEVYCKFNDNRKIAEDIYNIKVSEQSYKGRGVIQPALWESNQGVHMYMRSTEGKIYRSDSYDNGQTFCGAYATELPNNNSGIDITPHDDGRLYLVYNPVGITWGPRTPLYLSVSDDNGLSWKKIMVLEDGDGEYSYPAIISHNGILYITYTYDRRNIAFWEIII